jgi:rhodanese-related sulfurtransferase
MAAAAEGRSCGGEEGVVPQNVTRDEVGRLIENGAQLVDVLARSEYDDLHLAGAISMPLQELGARASAEVDPRRPVITYCHDYL